MNREMVEARLELMRLRLPERGVCAICWMGVTVRWQRLAKREGGYIKRNGSYGKYLYEYREKELSLEEAIAELMRPQIVRQVLAEADDIIKETGKG